MARMLNDVCRAAGRQGRRTTVGTHGNQHELTGRTQVAISREEVLSVHVDLYGQGRAAHATNPSDEFDEVANLH